MDRSSPASFGPVLRRLRQAAALSQEELAERAGLSVRGLSDLERGRRVAPRPETVRLLADALALGVADRAALIAAARPELAASPPAADPPVAAPAAPVAAGDRRPWLGATPPTRLVGREVDVAEVCALLRREDVRLLTLTGPSGVGKTRLALVAAGELDADERFADGVALVELAPVRDPALVASAIATVLGVKDGGGQPLADSLAAELQGRRFLLVLDNFEHVLPAAVLVADLLAGCPRLAVMATGRERLHLRGEREKPVAPLALPAPPEPLRPVPLDVLARIAAVRLFVERAEEARPGFALTPENAPVVAEICRRLDGLPLAIELAAARIKLLPPRAMLARLERRLPLLTGGARDLPARQQTLRGAIAWSYDLLTPDEQKLYRRLAVFAGGWTLDAAEAVAGSPDSGELGLGVLEGLGLLVDHSLVRLVEEGDEPRFGMLETIREFGRERVQAEGEVDEAAARHAAFFLALAEAAGPELVGPDQAAWFDRLSSEHDNLRAALTWALGHDVEAARRLGGALWRFWWVRGHVGEGWGWLERALAGGGGAAGVRAAALVAAGNLASVRGDHDLANAVAEEGLALFRDLGDKRGAADALDVIAVVLYEQGAFVRAKAVLEEELALRRELGDRRGIGVALNNLGEEAFLHGEYDRAAAHYEEALAALRAAGDTSTVATVLLNLGTAHAQRGDARGWGCLREAAALARELGDREQLAWVLEGAATLAQRGGRPRSAARLLGAAGVAREEIGVPLPPGERVRWFESIVAALRGGLGEAALSAAWEEGRALPLDEAVAEALALAEDVVDASTGLGGEAVG